MSIAHVTNTTALIVKDKSKTGALKKFRAARLTLAFNRKP